jgi:hypothetical protein
VQVVVRDWLLTHGGDARRAAANNKRAPAQSVDPHRGRICPSRRESSCSPAGRSALLLGDRYGYTLEPRLELCGYGS